MLILRIAVFLMGFFPPTDCLGNLYVWDPSGHNDSPSPKQALWDRPEVSFINIMVYEGIVHIHQVQKGSSWPEGESFCSPMLPITIRDTLKKTDYSSITEMSVSNFAVPKIAGCKCYVRTMVEFGLTLVNGEILSNDAERIEEFCTRHSEDPSVSLSGSLPQGEAFRLGKSDNDRLLKLLSFASIYHSD
jgi:hypothetical protein